MEHLKLYDKVRINDLAPPVLRGRTGMVIDTTAVTNIGVALSEFNLGHDLKGELPPGSKNGYYVPRHQIDLIGAPENIVRKTESKVSVVWHGMIEKGLPVQSYKSQENQRRKVETEAVKPNVKVRLGRRLMTCAPRIFDHLYTTQ